MMNKKIIYSIFTALTLITFSCSNDYLDVEPSQFLTQDQVAAAAENNPDVIAGSMAGIYTLMFQAGTGGTTGHDDFGQKGYDIYADMLSGDMALSVSTYGWYRRLTEFQVTQDFTNNGNYKVWRYYYRIIRSTNLVIDALGGNDAIPEVDENKWILGQAKAIRANSYFYLAQYFANGYNPSDEILPVYTSTTDQTQPKATTQVVFDLMIKDLTEAITLLENFNRSAPNEVNKSVAQGILAYVYGVMDGKDAELKTLTNDIINTSGFTIMGPNEVTGGFNDIYASDWMWGIDITLDNGLDLVSWWGQMDVFTYSYAWAGDAKAIDQDLYDAIPSNDVRKGQFYGASGYYYLLPINKFYDPARQIGGQRNIETDYVFMRISEMYLLNAEASAKSGDEATAKMRLKQLLDLRVPDTSYIDALSGQALIDEIYLQTRIEFWGEGKSYLALKRFRESTTRGSNHLSNVGTTISYDDDRLTFEIPESEIQNNPFITN